MLCANPNDEICMPPEVCANFEDNKQEHLLRHHIDPYDGRLEKFMKRDKPLVVAIFAMVVVMNVPYIRFILYPFMIFSTWVHEMCHGLAAIFVGGGIKELFIYEDGSGLASTYTSGEVWKMTVVASAGYTGTAIIGSMLLLFRRTRRGPTYGSIGIGIAMLLSCALYVRNSFGLGIIITIGVAVIILSWKLKAELVGYLYSFLASTCAFNAVESIHDLYGGQGYVNGELHDSDAHSVAEYLGTSYILWATVWLIFAVVMSLVGLLFVIDGITFKIEKNQNRRDWGASSSQSPDYEEGRMGGTILPSTPRTNANAPTLDGISVPTNSTAQPNKVTAALTKWWKKDKTVPAQVW